MTRFADLPPPKDYDNRRAAAQLVFQLFEGMIDFPRKESTTAEESYYADINAACISAHGLLSLRASF